MSTFNTLREANVARQRDWCPDQLPDLSFRGNELAGETGEVCNVIKKLERERLGWRGSRDTLEHLAEELGDVVICADLIAISAGIDLDAAVEAKFNATSEKVGLPHRLASQALRSQGEAIVTLQMEEAGRAVAATQNSTFAEIFEAMLAAAPGEGSNEAEAWCRVAGKAIDALDVISCWEVEAEDEDAAGMMADFAEKAAIEVRASYPAVSAEIAAIAQPPAEGVKVKPLEWNGDEAATPFGQYRLYRTDDGWGLSFNYDELVHVGFNSVGPLESPREKAKSYAHPHYSAAILSALEHQP